MWLNTTLIHEKGYTLTEVIVLQLLKQNRTEEQGDYIAMYADDDMFEKFTEQELIATVKKKKKSDSDFSVLRLSKKGEQILEDVQIPEISQGDLDMFAYLENMYLQDEDKERVVGNKKKTKQHCATFRKLLGLTLHEMYWLCWLFLDEYKFSRRLEYIFLDSNKNRYGSLESNINDSPLYQFYENNRQRIEKFWQQKIKNNE
jgi:hypothetical protein